MTQRLICINRVAFYKNIGLLCGLSCIPNIGSPRKNAKCKTMLHMFLHFSQLSPTSKQIVYLIGYLLHSTNCPFSALMCFCIINVGKVIYFALDCILPEETVKFYL